MAEPDWTRGDLDHRMRAVMVDPRNLTTVRGELAGLVPTGRHTIGYYTDLRTTSTVETHVPVGEGDGWDGSSAIRLVHVVSDHTGDLWDEVLGTYLVTGLDVTEDAGGTRRSYTLKGMLRALEANALTRGWTVNKGMGAVDAMTRLLSNVGRAHRVMGGARNARLSSAVSYDAGKSCLSALFDMCDRSRNRLGVDPDGYVTIRPYVAPSTVAPSLRVDAGDPRGVYVGPFGTSDAVLGMPSRAVVIGTKGQGAKVYGVAVAPTGTRTHPAVRGYSLDEVKTVNDMNPFTAARADAVARQTLSQALSGGSECSHGLRYVPLRDGFVEALTAPDGTTARWLVKSADLDLGAWTWDVSLVGGWK